MTLAGRLNQKRDARDTQHNDSIINNYHNMICYDIDITIFLLHIYKVYDYYDT